MTGPSVIPIPRAGDNAIGKFQIGISSIGDIPPFSFWDTVISQYANSTNLTSIIDNFDQCVDQTANLDAFFDNIMNIDTAVGYGLDVWGRILGVGRVITVQTGRFFGFHDQSPTVDPFNQSAFFSGIQSNNNFNLSDASFRKLLNAKALANITNGTIPALNQILITLFPGQGNAYVTDDGHMSMTYTFNFILAPVDAAIVTSSGVLPRPTGVALSFVQL